MQAGTQIRDYRFDALVGEGGMAEVWRARHLHLDKDVAIKVLSPGLLAKADFEERFQREARAMARLQHPNILGAIDFFIEEGGYYLVMPYVNGGSLSERMDHESGKVAIEECLAISHQILAALDFAHQKGLIHRDVKPSNILLDSEGRAFLAEFGIALMMGEDRKTRTGTSIGTPHYMSPEQILRPKNMDHRSDVYSYGCVLYEMLTGRAPFQAEAGDDGDTDFVVKTAHVHQAVPDPRTLNPAIPPQVRQTVMKAMAKDPDLRFAGCGEFAESLMEVTNSFQRIPKSSHEAPVAPRASTTVPFDSSAREGRSAGVSSHPTLPSEALHLPVTTANVQSPSGVRWSWVVGGLVLFGIVLIVLIGNSRSGSNPLLVVAPAVAPPGTIQPQTAKPQTAVPVSAEVQARISRMEEAVLAEPKNHTAWFALGNEYFDSHQHQKAVDAYAKGLALHPDDPNVLTDQGVMYRELGQFDKALANFQKANKLDPNHLQSLFNIGVLYHTNLNKPEEAAKAWKQVVTLAPNSEQASQARQMLNQLKK